MSSHTRRRRLEPLTQRFKRVLTRIRGGFHKKQRVYVLDLHNARVKHIVVADSFLASEIAENLTRLRSTNVFPELLAQHRNELWVEFVEGEAVGVGPDTPVRDLAHLFSTLYGVEATTVACQDRTFAAEILRDIDFLRNAGVISAEVAAGLITVCHRSTPTDVWVGYDYGDARPGNFLLDRENRIRIIDVESIRRDTLIGIGVARACSRWPGLTRESFLAALREQRAPDFMAYFDFVELYFRTTWTKRCVLLEKTKLIDPVALERLAGIMK